MQRRILTAAAGIAAASLLLAGCSADGGSSDELNTTDEITLTVQQQTGTEALFEAVIAAFEDEYPNVTVEVQTISQEQKIGSNLTVLGSNDPPDVAVVPINSEVYTQLARADALEPVDDVWEDQDLATRYGDAVASSLQVDGVPLTVAYAPTLYDVVWLNPDILSAAGLAAPEDHRFESVDQFIEYATTLKDQGYGGFYIGGGSQYHASWMIDALLGTAASAEEHENYLASANPAVDVSVEYTDQPFVETLESLQRMNEAGVYQEGFLGQDAPTAFAPFLGGEAGMAIGGTFNATEFISEGIDFAPTWAILPPVDDAESPALLNQYFGDALGVPANSDQVAWGKEFLAFVMSDSTQKNVLVDEVGYPPAVNTITGDDLSALPELTQELIQDVADNGGRPGWTSTVPGGLGQQFVDPLVQQMYSGDLTPEQVAAEMQDRLVEYREDAE